MRKIIEKLESIKTTHHAFVHIDEDLIPVLVVVALVRNAVFAEGSLFRGGFCRRLASASPATFTIALVTMCVRVGQLLLFRFHSGVVRLEGSDAQRIWDAVRVEDGLRVLIEYLFIDNLRALGLALDALDSIVIFDLQRLDTLTRAWLVTSGMSIWVRAA